MNSGEAILIADGKTTEDWAKLRPALVRDDEQAWGVASEEFFFSRLNTRYLEPIKALRKSCEFRGEGFAIVAVQCSLVEFLESTAKGLNYRYFQNGQQLGQFEYCSSSRIFVDFLSARIPFSRFFTSVSARDFYIGVRCGLLHEARTKNGWRIKATHPQSDIVDTNSKVVYRNDFQDALIQYISNYRELLPTSKEMKEAFIRKFDDLCT